ncbi:MAG: hypothetical protein CM1200mP20_07600 [Pseudomonadota bacterium]|nr:MAG: hypothetical protein CM1200mP20_07600 [Pseudomonadota bacterium]
MVPGDRVVMNNFLNWGDLDPASPNAIRPGQRLAMCMAPTITTAAGQGVLAWVHRAAMAFCRPRYRQWSATLILGLNCKTPSICRERGCRTARSADREPGRRINAKRLKSLGIEFPYCRPIHGPPVVCRLFHGIRRAVPWPVLRTTVATAPRYPPELNDPIRGVNMKRIIQPEKGAAPKGPYSPGIVVDGTTLYVSAQGPFDPETGEVVGTSFEEQESRYSRTL